MRGRARRLSAVFCRGWGHLDWLGQTRGWGRQRFDHVHVFRMGSFVLCARFEFWATLAWSGLLRLSLSLSLSLTLDLSLTLGLSLSLSLSLTLSLTLSLSLTMALTLTLTPSLALSLA